MLVGIRETPAHLKLRVYVDAWTDGVNVHEPVSMGGKLVIHLSKNKRMLWS